MSYKEAEQEWEEILVDGVCTVLKGGTKRCRDWGRDIRWQRLEIAAQRLGIWGFYYAMRLLLNRIHPSMPPAIMMAAGVCAPTIRY
jgi:hypothetical protein